DEGASTRETPTSMSDIPGFPPEDTGRPPSRREVAQRDKEYRALVAGYEQQDYGKVRNAAGLRANAEARLYINRAVQRLDEERDEHLGRLRWMHDGLLTEMLGTLAHAFRGGDYQRTADILKVMERQARLQGLDAVKDDAGGAQVVVIDT